MRSLIRLFEHFFWEEIRRHQHRHGHRRRGFLFFIAIQEGGEHTMTKTQIQAPAGAVTSITADFAGVLAVVFLQAGDDGAVLAGKGPFEYSISDPAGLFKFTQGAADGSTPSLLQLVNATASGSADVTATDSGTGITSTATITATPVTPPPPPPVGPTQGAVFFVPQAAAPASTDAPAGTEAPAAAVAGHPEVAM